MNHKYTKKISCSNCLQCSKKIVNEVEEKLNIKLMARKETDVVNGFINILHDDPHIIEITLYDKDESSNNKHKSTFKKPKTKESELKKL